MLTQIRKGKQPEDCWIWMGSRSTRGYGQLWVEGTNCCAHRLVYLALVGPILEWEYVLHRCDVRLCVNPSHLYTGNASQNMKDRTDRDRCNAPTGEDHWQAKLTQEQAEWIRKNSCIMTQRQLAAKFRVDRSTVSRILHNKRYPNNALLNLRS